MKIKSIAGAIAAIAVLWPAVAQAHFPAKCADTLNFFSVEHLGNMAWRSEESKSKAREFLAKPDMIRLRSWVAYVDAYQTQLAKGMLPVLKDLLKCIADNAAAAAVPLSAEEQTATATPSYECKRRLVKVRYAVTNLESSYARRKRDSRCRDTKSPAGKVICAQAVKRYNALMAGKRAGLAARRRWAAKVCAPGDML